MPITDDAIEKIKGMIVSGELRPGDRLPKEADLAAQLGLSRNSLREAVRALSLVRILDVRQGDGTYVTSLEPKALLDGLSFIVDLHHDKTVLEFFEVRRILEPAATALAAQKISLETIDALRDHLAKVTDESAVEDLVENDLEFHRRIAEAAGNSVLYSLVDTMCGPTIRARVWRGLTQEGALRRTLDEHHAILDALATRQTDVARALATVHVAGVEQWLRKAL
ncbi:FadR/GntR family transcriptional regulator [Actinoallomurus sp. NPDC050550]|uniref:FadR/GntR family transcriptional regulator n=1 Tax=unclassified Actinoallomurus TaxID=2624323 RepID=UPI0033D2890E